ncbi:unnamed protein product [Ilex paraguariensis]|uniref:Uncharacterized protein n=1 Tax=Ilex paraguariensis TaxID=185542 RepID=A0ABC8U3R7_9AQUA
MKRIISYGVSVITSTNVATHVSTTKLAKYSSCKGVCSDLCDRLAAKQEKINGETTDVILDVTMGTSVRGEGEWTTVGATDMSPQGVDVVDKGPTSAGACSTIEAADVIADNGCERVIDESGGPGFEVEAVSIVEKVFRGPRVVDVRCCIRISHGRSVIDAATGGCLMSGGPE